MAHDELWLEAEVAAHADDLALEYFGDLLGIGTTGAMSSWNSLGIASVNRYNVGGETGVAWAIDIGSDGTPGSVSNANPPVAATYQLLELHWQRNVVIEVYASSGGSPICTSTTDDDRAATRIAVGQYFGGNEVYFKNVKCGTTRHGVDVFSDTFASGDLAAWTGTYDSGGPGFVAVVNDPFA